MFPSIYEGFGLPVAEAVLSGTLAIASDSSSMKELVLDAELRFDPHDPVDIARCIANCLVLLSCGLYGNTLRVLTPLTISDALLHEGLDLLEKSLTEAIA